MQLPLRQPDDPGLDPPRPWREGDYGAGHGTVCGCEACAVRQGEGESSPVFAYLNVNERGGTAPNGKVSFTLDQVANRLTGGEAGWAFQLNQADCKASKDSSAMPAITHP